MPQSLQQQLQELRDQLINNPPLNDEERAALGVLLQDIELKLQESAVVRDNSDSLVDGVNLAIERFEVSHPTVTATLRSILQSLVSMGI